MMTVSATVRLLKRPDTGALASMRQLVCLAALLIGLTVPTAVTAADYPDHTGPVVDQAQVLSASTRNELTDALRAHRDQFGDQIALATVSRLDGVRIEHFANGLARAWQLGEADRDNGVLVVLALDERKVRIEVGYGLEETLTDSRARDIIRDDILPRFRQGDIDGGAKAGMYAILSQLQNPGAAPAKPNRSLPGMAIPLIFAALFAASQFLKSQIRTRVIGTIVVSGAAAMVVNGMTGQWLFGLAAALVAAVLMYRQSQGTMAANPHAGHEPSFGKDPTHTDKSPAHNQTSRYRSDSENDRGGGGGFGGGGASGGW